MDLLFDLTGTLRPAIVGAMTRAIISEPTGEHVDFLGVRFRPGEAFGMLGCGEARGMRDKLVPLDDVWGRPGRELGERLALQRSVRERIAILSAELLRRPVLAPDARVRRAVQVMRDSHGSLRVAEVAASVGAGERQLERLFDARVGVGPKALASIFRVQAMVARAPVHGDWARLAADLGYCDQAHLTRDLGRLAGVTPSELARAIRRRVRAREGDESDASDGMSELSNLPHGPLPIVGT
jgi:AraC-like DNA-binding protein